MKQGGSFASGAINAVDAKGRVSLPSSFRTTIDNRLRGAGYVVSEEPREPGSIYLREHRSLPCLTGYDLVQHEQLIADIEEQVSDLRGIERADAREALSAEILGAARVVAYDSAGRMILPASLRTEAKIGELAYFLTGGQSFQIWAPEVFRKVNADNQQRVRAMEGLLSDRGRP